jgi:hypothetical protein
MWRALFPPLVRNRGRGYAKLGPNRAEPRIPADEAFVGADHVLPHEKPQAVAVRVKPARLHLNIFINREHEEFQSPSPIVLYYPKSSASDPD